MPESPKHTNSYVNSIADKAADLKEELMKGPNYRKRFAIKVGAIVLAALVGLFLVFSLLNIPVAQYEAARNDCVVSINLLYSKLATAEALANKTPVNKFGEPNPVTNLKNKIKESKDLLSNVDMPNEEQNFMTAGKATEEVNEFKKQVDQSIEELDGAINWLNDANADHESDKQERLKRQEEEKLEKLKKQEEEKAKAKTSKDDKTKTDDKSKSDEKNN